MENPIKTLRLKTKMSQAEFARTFNLTQGAVSHWEQDMQQPDRKNFLLLMKLAKKFQFEAEIIKHYCKDIFKVRS